MPRRRGQYKGNTMIIITGATGHFGRLVAERLLDRVPAGQIGVSVRDPGQAQVWADRGVRVRQGDFRDPASLRHAFEGASQVLVVSGTTLGPAGVQQHGSAIDAAKAVGASHILYTSHMAAANPQSAFGPARDHAATEALLQSSGLPFTSLRNGFYAESALWFGNPRQTDTLALPQDGPVSWTSRSDLADAAVTALTQPGSLSGITPPLTNPEALDFAAIARIASELLRRQIKREVVSEDAFRQSKINAGLPEPLVNELLGFFLASRHGELAAVDPTLERLLGRPALSMRSFLSTVLAEGAE